MRDSAPPLRSVGLADAYELVHRDVPTDRATRNSKLTARALAAPFRPRPSSSHRPSGGGSVTLESAACQTPRISVQRLRRRRRGLVRLRVTTEVSVAYLPLPRRDNERKGKKERELS